MTHDSTSAPAALYPAQTDNETGRRVFDDPHGRVAAQYPVTPAARQESAERTPSDDLWVALHTAEAALADIGDADREPGDDLAWCERRAAKALPQVRAALARRATAGTTAAPSSDDARDAARYRLLRDAEEVPGQVWAALESGEGVDEAMDLFATIVTPIAMCEPCKAGRYTECEYVLPCTLPADTKEGERK